MDVIGYKVQDRKGVDPLIPWWLLQIMDLVWCGSLASANRFAVPEPPILVTRRILQFDEEFEVDDKSFQHGLQSKRGGIHDGIRRSALPPPSSGEKEEGGRGSTSGGGGAEKEEEGGRVTIAESEASVV